MKRLTAILLFMSFTTCGQTIVSAQAKNAFNNHFSVSCLHFQDSIKERPPVEDWIKMDTERIESIFNKVPQYGSTLDSLILLLPNLLNGKGNASSAKHELGNELELLEYTLYGGYSSLRFEILHFKGNVLRINQYISSYAELIENRFLPLIKIPLSCRYGYAENETYFPQNVRNYKNSFPEFYLDTLKNNNGNHDIEALVFFSDYSDIRQYFKSPMHVSDSYWEPAFDHIRYLVQNRKIELLEKLLHSPLPSGRVFAASALNYLYHKEYYQPNEIVLAEIEEIRKNGTIFTSGTLSCWSGKFDYDYYHVYEYFEKLIIK